MIKKKNIIIKGSLDEKLPSYEVLRMRENRCVENGGVCNVAFAVAFSAPNFWIFKLAHISHWSFLCVFSIISKITCNISIKTLLR